MVLQRATDLPPTNLPQHVAIIMDGNGRWASIRGLSRVEGHREGANRVREIVEESRRMGIRYLTLFCFSTENWKRPPSEVSSLMQLFVRLIKQETPNLKKNGVRVKIIGNRSMLSPIVQRSIEEAEMETEINRDMELILAISYGGREDILQAVRNICKNVQEGRIKPEEIDTQTVADALYTKGIPDPDMIIRTSGECRISNFLLWQCAYSELVVSERLWPDFRVDDFRACIDEFAKRERKFGLTSEQVKEKIALSG